ncbi:MAG: hydantoinase/oxoprolinase family protein [Rhodospirillales bacterium]|nr:hydantoinase/oxoprolinase family protein [Rhodospirillales bacterium]
MAEARPRGDFQVCIDIGGTFTDCVVSDADQRLRIFKTPSTPAAFELGFMNALKLAAGGYELALPDFMARVARIVHGTTVSTNALLEEKHAPVGLICTHGFRDILTLREAPRKPPFKWRLAYPEPFVPRIRTRGVRGRIDATGAEHTPLEEDDVRAAVEDFRRLGVEAVAVCLLWSVVNGDHERRVGEIVREAWPEVPVTLSHRLNPIAREYRRAVSAAIDAALRPVVSAYVHALDRGLRKSGYGNELMIANCLGGMMPPDEIAERPIYSVMSGPTLAPVAAKQLTDAPDLVVVDMGGTSFDVSAVREGQLVISPEAMLTEFDMLGIPKVDVRSVGAGGGSIAHVDAGGLLRVGPESAGADPGPACYGLGAMRPTVTDADVVLGIIDPDYFLGGRMHLDREAAEHAVGTIADALGIGLAAAARAIASTVDHTMIAAIEDITVQEGIDPRESYFVAGGGATAVHMGQMARVLGIKGYMVPKFSAGLSAFGGLISDIVWEETATLVTDAARFDLEGVNVVLAGLEERGRAFLARAGIAEADQRFEYAYLGRYQYQSWEIEVPFGTSDGALAAGDVAGLADGFHRMHERIYTIRNENDLVEFTTWKVRAIGPAAADLAPVEAAAAAQEASPHGTRLVHLPGRDAPEIVPVYRGDDLAPGARINGPAIVEEATTTVLVPEDAEAVIDPLGNYRVTLE